MSDIKNKLDSRQDEYFRLLIKVVNNDDTIVTKDKGYTDNLERLKELQIDIIVFTTTKFYFLYFSRFHYILLSINH